MELLEQWKKHAESAMSSIEKRNYRECRLAYRHGSRCFNQLSCMIREKRGDELLAHEKVLRETIAKWREVTEALKPWMKETEVKARKIRSRRLKRGKVGRVYNKYRSRTGNNLRVKARH